MKKLFMVTVLLTLLCGGLWSVAEAKDIGSLWGASADEIRAAYPAASSLATSAGDALDIRSATLGGVHWSRIQLRFDRDGQLVHVRLWTQARSFEQMEADLSNGDGLLWKIGGDGPGRAPAQKVMLCDYGAAGVVLSFDQPKAALAKTITASLEPSSATVLAR
jgi:hypothetical protein